MSQKQSACRWFTIGCQHILSKQIFNQFVPQSARSQWGSDHMATSWRLGSEVVTCTGMWTVTVFFVHVTATHTHYYDSRMSHCTRRHKKALLVRIYALLVFAFEVIV